MVQFSWQITSPTPAHPLDFPLPSLSPVLQDAVPPPPREGLGHFSPKVKHRQDLRTPSLSPAVGGLADSRGLRAPSPARRTGVRPAGPGPLFTPHSPLGLGYNLDTSLTTSDFLL